MSDVNADVKRRRESSCSAARTLYHRPPGFAEFLYSVSGSTVLSVSLLLLLLLLWRLLSLTLHYSTVALVPPMSTTDTTPDIEGTSATVE